MKDVVTVCREAGELLAYEPSRLTPRALYDALAQTLAALRILMGNGDGRAFDDIAFERSRQQSGEGFSLEHDDALNDEELAVSAAGYALPFALRSKLEIDLHRFGACDIKPDIRRRDLVKAGALIVAEIERLDRAAAREGKQP